ncbi:Hsp20 family protein [Martelella sp. HB161492]|uniref:Hsp20 family protein n=1 Tax=Martelella sp. HB161492 TaxID=2720726 RepID=UPI0015906054|nr:Hsp20 family protein [Martelella sp. HB161492]
MARIDLRLDPLDMTSEMLAALSRGSGGYPPFDIEYLHGAGAYLRITVAVAGFEAEELDVTTEGHQLVIRGSQDDKPDGDFLYRGIAGRQFRRIFLLTEAMEVTRASLQNGLLAIEIARRPADVRKINISVSD